MTRVPLLVGGSPAAAAMPPVDLGSDSDEDHPLHEPRFVIHAVDDDDRRRPPAPALLPIQQHRPPPALEAAAAAAQERGYLYREVARLERLRYFLILPLAVVCSWVVILGILIICLANNDEARTNLVWLIACSALVMLFSLVSLLLSHLAVYYFDGWPGLNGWLR